MMEKIKNIIKHNIILKLISLVIGFVIWALAYNVSNPEVTETVTCILNVRNEDELTSIDKTYSIDTSIVRITYKVRSQDKRKVSTSEFEAYVDLSDYSVTGAVPIYYNVSSAVLRYINSVTVSPIVAHVEVVDMAAKSFTVETNITGTVADGMAAAAIELSSEKVTLYGPVSDIGRIARVTADISIDGAEDAVSGMLELVFYDSSDNVITFDENTRIQNEISYEIPVYKTKKLSVTASYSGVPAAGYTLNSFTTEPSYITVYGPQEILDQYTAINIPENIINLEGTTTNVAVLIDATAYVPDGLYVLGESDISIVASVGRSSMPAVSPQPPRTTEAATTQAVTEAETEAVTEAVNESDEEAANGAAGDENGTSVDGNSAPVDGAGGADEDGTGNAESGSGEEDAVASDQNSSSGAAEDGGQSSEALSSEGGDGGSENITDVDPGSGSDEETGSYVSYSS